jgi:cytochrome c oxidase subunit III
MAETQMIVEPGPKQPYHLVNPSPWPLLGSLAGGLLAFGAIRVMHNNQYVWLFVGLAAVLGVMFGWWRDVIKESTKEKAHTPIVKVGLRYGMSLFIASEVMFFAAFFWAFFASAMFPSMAIEGVWPPKNIHPIDPWHFPLLMTMILLLSGCTVTWAHHAILEGHKKEASQALGITVLLGVVFTIIQAYEYIHAPFGFREGIFSSTFYMATGFHGFHVIVGTIFLAVCWFRLNNDQFTPTSHFGFEAAAWYWHFVDVVWLFLFAMIYVAGGAGWLVIEHPAALPRAG